MTTSARERDDGVRRLAEEVGRLAGRMQEIRAELQWLAVTPLPGPVLAPTPAPVAGSRAPGFPAAPPPGFPAPAAPPHVPWWRREGAVSRVVAVAGSAVTLLGVVLLLVLAAQGGFFGPVPRVVGGALLAGALLAVAPRVRRREEGGTGSVALAGTGVAGLYLDVVAAAHYGWLPVWAGLVLGAAVAAGGMVLARHWDSQLLAVLAVAGAAVLAPVLSLTSIALLAGYLLVLQAGSAVLAPRPWSVLVGVRSAPPALALVFGAGLADDERGWLLAIAVLGVVLGVGLALRQLRHAPGSVVDTLALAVAVVPVLVVTAPLDRWTAVAVTGTLAVVLGALALGVVGRQVGARARGALLVLGSVALLQATATMLDAYSFPAAVLGEAVALTVLAHRLRSRVVLAVAGAYGVLGLGALGVLLPVDVLTSSSATVREATPLLALAAALLAVAAAVLAGEVRWSHVVPRPQPLLWIAGAAGLYGLVASVVTTAVLLLGRDGFVVGHGAATVIALLVGLVLLTRDARPGAGAELRLPGLVLLAAALGKLLLFDLSALNGVVRVAAFLVSGLLLLAQGSRVAAAPRSLAAPEQDAEARS